MLPGGYWGSLRSKSYKNLKENYKKIIKNKTVSKSEMGLRYFPQLTKHSASVKLVEYLKDCPEWHPGYDFKKRKYYTPSEVRQVEKIMG